MTPAQVGTRAARLTTCSGPLPLDVLARCLAEEVRPKGLLHSFSHSGTDHEVQDVQHDAGKHEEEHEAREAHHTRTLALTTVRQAKLRRTGLDRHFEVVMTSSTLGAAKPCPEAFLLACELLSADPAPVAHVGDRLDVDAQAATAAGLRGTWLDRDGRGGGDHIPTIS